MLGKKLGKSEQPWPLAPYKKRDPNRGADPKQQDSWVTRGDVIICYQVSTASKGTIKVNELSC